ncbi:hypothetical protein [Permianibacter aggregans]|uniref:hypothetical protein n=1 Tax=Permianibacter aggregans TaxID=1510150 RepID=UPI00105D5523|nr:hypothetical protein [Permianibacter aggregans]QGX38312.1 hypothetical protein E2H98_00965 [Permianibacter aggregans]
MKTKSHLKNCLDDGEVREEEHRNRSLQVVNEDSEHRIRADRRIPGIFEMASRNISKLRTDDSLPPARHRHKGSIGKAAKTPIGTIHLNADHKLEFAAAQHNNPGGQALGCHQLCVQCARFPFA